MIKINLIAEGRRPVAAMPTPAAAVGDGEGLALGSLVGLLLLGIVVTLGHFWILSNKVGEMKEEVAVAQRKVDELRPFIREVEEFKAKKADLESKVRVINSLKANQRGPVQIMDQVSQALPELLWLNRMEVGPTTITVSGQTFNTNAVANFIENLDKVPEFQEPILRDTARRGEVYSFVVAFNYTYASPAGEASDAAAAGG